MKMQQRLFGVGVLMVLSPCFGAGTLFAQTDARLRVDWDKFAARASERTEVTLDGGMLRSVARFLTNDDSDSKDLQKLLSGLQGVYVHSYTFKGEHEYPDADVDSLRQQLKGGNWGRIVQSTNREAGEHNEVYLKNIKHDGDPSGLVVLVAEPREFTLVEIAGKIDPKDLGKLDGALHFSRHGSADHDEN